MRLFLKKTIILLFLFLFLQGKSNNRNYVHHLYYEVATSNQREFLINFAIKANDVYQTRTVNRKKAKKVFAIPESSFQKGLVKLCKLHGEIVGFFSLKINSPIEKIKSCELNHLFVKPNSQHKGIGTLLFQQAIILAQSMGFNRLEWISDPDAQEFYIKKGAIIVGYEENLLNPQEKLPLFELTI